MRLVLAEPFRGFFPWGLVVGMIGVGLWPAFYAGWLPIYPGQPFDLHARLMILGMGGAFVLGFLATAAPRMLGVAALRPMEAGLLWLLHAASVVAWLGTQGRLGAGLFAAAVTLLLLLLSARFRHRTDLPPPGFVLVLLGLLSGVIGALLQATGADMGGWPPGYRLARVLMNEAFLLLPLLGVSGFLMPRLFGLPGRHVFPDARRPSREWWILAGEAGSIGLLILLSLGVEAVWSLRVGVLIRLGVVLFWWHRDLPGLWTRRAPGTQAWAARLGLILIAIGWVAKALDPARYVGLEHLLFIGGFGIAMLAVAARVVDGHSGHRAQAKGVSKPLRWVVGLALLALGTRVVADYVPAIQRSHHIYASLTWIGLSVLWLWHHRRRLVTPE